MNFGEVQAIVVDITKRGDKIAVIRQGINAAIAFFAVANFENDHVELPNFVISSTDYAQSFDVTASPFVRFKVINYIRPTGYGCNLKWRDPKHIFKNGHEIQDVYYRSGNNIVFKLSNLQPELKLGYFQYHVGLINATDTDWMLDELSVAVQKYAVAELMGDIGEDAEYNKYKKESILLWEAYKNSVVAVQA